MFAIHSAEGETITEEEVSLFSSGEREREFDMLLSSWWEVLLTILLTSDEAARRNQGNVCLSHDERPTSASQQQPHSEQQQQQFFLRRVCPWSGSTAAVGIVVPFSPGRRNHHLHHRLSVVFEREMYSRAVWERLKAGRKEYHQICCGSSWKISIWMPGRVPLPHNEDMLLCWKSSWSHVHIVSS